MARDYYRLEPDRMYRIGQHYTPGRAGAKIEFITRHHLMYIGEGEAVVDKIWNTRQASAHHVIGPTGRWVQAVYDRDTAWANANQWANQRTIAIEHANSTGRAPGATDFNAASWNISDETIITGARVGAAYCLAEKLGKPVYGKTIRDHFEFTSTGCPVHLQGPHPKNSWGGRAGKYHHPWMEEAVWFYDQLDKKLVHPDGTPVKMGFAPPKKPAPKPAEKLLDYPRDQVKQDTFYNCGPASVQTVVRAATGNLITELELGRQLRTTRNGTDYIGQFPAVLNRHIPGARYTHWDMPTDPPTPEQKERLWRDLTASINAGHGVVANIVAPPSNYPRAVWPSTQNLAYSGGTVYHYVAVMGYAGEGAGRRVWFADSGFSPHGCWISFNQLSTLIPPKGYAYSTTPPPRKAGFLMALSDQEQEDLKKKIDTIHHELTERFQSRYVGPDGQRSTFRDTLIGYVLEADRKLEDVHRNNLPTIWNAVKALTARKGK